MYNPKYLNALDAVPAGQGTYTTFTDISTNTVVEVLVEPSERGYSYSAEYSKLLVKGTKHPLLCYQQSELTLSIPNLLFWTYGNNKDVTPVLTAIAAFTQPVAKTGEPPVLKLTIGKEVWERVRISKFTYKTKMHRSGTVLMAEGSLDLLIDPIPPKQGQFVEAKPDTPAKLSQPEQTTATALVKKTLEGDVTKATKFKYTKGKSKITVGEDGKVKLDGTVIGLLKDILGSATPAGLNSSTLTTKK